MTIGEIIALSAALTALGALSWQIWQSTRQAKMQIFIVYTQRYHDIMLKLPIDVESSDFNIDSLEPANKAALLRAMRAYYDLCSEEFYLRKNFDRKVWSMWKRGMEYAFVRPAFRDAWDLLPNKKEYDEKRFTGFVKEVHESAYSTSGANQNAQQVVDAKRE